MADENQSDVAKLYSSFVLLWNPEYFAWTEQDRLEALAYIDAGEAPEDHSTLR